MSPSRFWKLATQFNLAPAQLRIVKFKEIVYILLVATPEDVYFIIES